MALLEKDMKLDEKSATFVGLMNAARTAAVAKAAADKRVKQTNKMQQTLVEKTKEVEVLKAEIKTRDAIISILKTEGVQSNQEELEVVEEEVGIVIEEVEEVERKKCKKCSFTAENIQVLKLHIENNHQGNLFECDNCRKKFPFKNPLKLHKRQDHEEGTFSCFVCNSKFRTHKELNQHMQRKCKTQNQHATRITSRSVNEDIAPEDEFRCTKCDKVTNNQISFINHIQEKHTTVENAFTGNKCVTCSGEFGSRELLVKHIEDNHIQKNNIIKRHICAICNVEVHGNETRDNHMCRKPEHKCSFCQTMLYSQEARRNHICSAHKFKTVEQQVKEVERRNIPCRCGDSCFRVAKGKCWFKHSALINTIPPQGQRAAGQGAGGLVAEQQGLEVQENDWRVVRRQGQGRQGARHQEEGRQGPGRQGARHHGAGHQAQGARQQGEETLWCKFQDKCLRRATCKFQHNNKGFRQINPVQNHQ